MVKVVKLSIQKILNRFGFEIKKTTADTYSWLINEEIETIFDIGANKGQFTIHLHKLLPDARIYGFEPLKSCFNELKHATANLSTCTCFNFAIGKDNGMRTIYHNDFTPSSSMLPMNDLHVDAFPSTKGVREEIIEVRRLDDVVKSLELIDNILIKIDVQGFEDKVIQGGEETIKRAKILIVETSFEPLYHNQLLFDGIYSILRSMGFVLKGFEEPLRHPRDGRILQCDSIFVKRVKQQ